MKRRTGVINLMSGILKKLKKVKGRSLGELRSRAGQSAAAYAERCGWAAQSRLPGDREFFKSLDLSQIGRTHQGDDAVHPNGNANGKAMRRAANPENVTAEKLLAHFRTRTRPLFFAPFNERSTVRELPPNFPRDEKARISLLARAECIVAEGRFDLLGWRGISFGDPIDWHLEPLMGKRTPLIHWSQINYLDAEIAGDKKITWELNRQQYFVTLGRAYLATGDERYARTFAAHLAAWMDANPPKLGINWTSSLEVSFRAISWLWALHFFRDSPHLDAPLHLRALKFLHLHARHLETFLSTYFSPNTHLTGEALGLYYLGTLLPEFRRASARWRAIGERILLDALDAQVRPDGVYFEGSTYYHRYTADFYLHYAVLKRVNGGRLDAHAERKLTALLDHLMYVTRPDGRTPFFGDDDGGRLMPLDERAADDFRSTLATGACLFARPDYKFVAGAASEELWWLLGRAGFDCYQELEARPPAETSRAFPHGGYYVMRDGWGPESNYLMLDCGPHGALPSYGHAHADALSFELAARGRAMLLDPGTYTYTGDARARDEFRSTAAHNALVIDEQSSSLPAGAFSWQTVARARAETWMSHPRFDYFAGTHDGFARLDPQLRYTRAIFFLKNDYWIVRDRVRGSDAAHAVALHFHFAPEDATPEVEATDDAAPPASAREHGAGVAGLTIYAFGSNGLWREERGWVSRQYGARTPAPVCVYDSTATGAQDFYTFMLPHAAGESAHAAQARKVEATGGELFEIERGVGAGDCDVLLMCGEDYAECGRLASDFEWAWARFAGGCDARATLEELVLIGGRRFSLDGQEIVWLTERAAYVVARRDGERLLLDIDGRKETVHLAGRYSVIGQ